MFAGEWREYDCDYELVDDARELCTLFCAIELGVDV